MARNRHFVTMVFTQAKAAACSSRPLFQEGAHDCIFIYYLAKLTLDSGMLPMHFCVTAFHVFPFQTRFSENRGQDWPRCFRPSL